MISLLPLKFEFDSVSQIDFCNSGKLYHSPQTRHHALIHACIKTIRHWRTCIRATLLRIIFTSGGTELLPTRLADSSSPHHESRSRATSGLVDHSRHPHGRATFQHCATHSTARDRSLPAVGLWDGDWGPNKSQQITMGTRTT